MTFSIFAACLCLGLAADAERPDILVADFEGDTYGDWKTTGTAFGKGPARGTLPNQMPVSGYEGKGYASSYHGGDASTGTLTSPPIRLQRRYLNFLIGGGKYPGKTCVNLLVDGKVVRTATGPNDRPGGSEQLDWCSWDIAEFADKEAVIQAIDERTEGWGHITLDQIVQSDRKRQTGPAVRELTITGTWLHLPVQTGGPKRRLKFVVDDKVVRECEIELADGTPTFWAFSDVSAFKGRKIRLEVDAAPVGAPGLTAITQGDEIKGEPLYHEKQRPQFHFTSRRGWLNDPNGLVFVDGEYHLFYQHNPYGWAWGNMHWGHAVSKDLVHWQELPVSIYPPQFGDWAFSGSAVVDTANTSGFGTPDAPALIAAFTSTGRGECLLASKDRGRTWTEFPGNPLVKHAGRDPRLLWHAPSKQWVMAVYDEFEGKQWIAFYTSPDLKKWQFRSRIEGYYECPDLYELAIDGDAKRTKWVLSAADGKYTLGDFDGQTFKVTSGKHQLWYGNFYAAQTFSNLPDGRRVQIGWGQGIEFPGAAFNQQMTVPVQLTLRTTPEGVRLFAEPVRELETLRQRKHELKAVALKPGENPLADVLGELFDIRAEFEVGSASAVGFVVRGESVVVDIKKGELQCRGRTIPLAVVDGKVRLRLLVDRGSVELFGNEGRVALSVGVSLAPENRTLEVFSRGGMATLQTLEVWELASAWTGR